jgi:hypothetical protein
MAFFDFKDKKKIGFYNKIEINYKDLLKKDKIVFFSFYKKTLFFFFEIL